MKWQPPAISLIWLTLLPFVGLELFCLWMYNFKWYDREVISFLGTVLAGAFGLFVFLKNIEEGRNRMAAQFVQRWNAQDLRVIINRTRPVVEGEERSEQYARPIYHAKTATAEQTQIRGDIIMILGLFEEIAISVFAKSANEDRLKDFFAAVIPGGYDGFQGFVLAERKEGKDDDYYKVCQRLVERWTNVRRPDRGI